jgi:hypothetical protein
VTVPAGKEPQKRKAGALVAGPVQPWKIPIVLFGGIDAEVRIVAAAEPDAPSLQPSSPSFLSTTRATGWILLAGLRPLPGVPPRSLDGPRHTTGEDRAARRRRPRVAVAAALSPLDLSSLLFVFGETKTKEPRQVRSSSTPQPRPTVAGRTDGSFHITEIGGMDPASVPRRVHGCCHEIFSLR